MRHRTIKVVGPFTDQDIADIVAVLRRIDDGNPTRLYVIDILDEEGSNAEGERLLTEILPQVQTRAFAFAFANARAAYRNDSYPERKCDRCEKLYRGPAVYCCLECALADAL